METKSYITDVKETCNL